MLYSYYTQKAKAERKDCRLSNVTLQIKREIFLPREFIFIRVYCHQVDSLNFLTIYFCMSCNLNTDFSSISFMSLKNEIFRYSTVN